MKNNMSKRILAAALAATTIFGTGLSAGTANLVRLVPISVTASAEESNLTAKVDGIKYTYDVNNGSANIISAEGTFPDDYTIPKKLGGINVKSIVMHAFANKKINKLHIPKNIVLEAGCFMNSIINKVYFADGCSVQDWAFDYGYWSFSGSTVNEAYFDENVTVIPAGILAGANNLEKVVFNGKVTVIEKYAFADCSIFTGIDNKYLSSLIEIGDSAFENTAYSNFKAPSKLKSVGFNAFKNTKIKDLNLGNIETIGPGAFASCNNIESVVIPDSVTRIEADAFANCKSLTSVEYNASNCVFAESSAHYATISSWANCSFEGTALTTVTIGKNVKTVPKHAFEYAESLKKVTFKGKIDAVESYAFYDCIALKDVYYPGSKTEWNKIEFGVENDALKNATIHFTTAISAPVVSATNVASSGKVKLTWNAVDGAVSYKVYRATSKTGTYKLMKTTTSTSYINTSATAGKTYYYKVKAVDKNGKTSNYSEIKTRTCDLARPTNVTITKTSKGNPKLTWSKVENATKYKVYRATSENGTYKLMKTTTSTSYTNTTYSGNTTYYYKVKAVCDNSAADSAFSTVKSIKTK